MNKRTAKDFVAEMQMINPDIIILGDYVNLKTKILCKCKKCEHEWLARPDHLLEGHGCPECMRIVISQKKTKTHEQFIKEIASINPSIEVLGTYKNESKRIACRCRKCGFQWEGLPSVLLRGASCPNCSKNKIHSRFAKTQEQFVQELSKVNPDIEVMGQYYNANTPIYFRCKRCNYIWKTQPNALLNNGSGCPNCVKYLKISFPETATFYYIKQLFPMAKQTCKDFGIELDIYIPEKKKAIEYDGLRWHKDKGDADNQKTIYCNEIGVELIHVREQGLLPLTNGKSIYRSNNISNKDLSKTITELLFYLSPDNTIDVDVDRDIKNIYELIPHENQTEKFLSRMATINPDIEIKSKYYQARKPVKCKCRKCGYEWESMPTNLLRGHGCPNCSGHAAVTNEEFVTILSKVNPNITLLSKYTNLQDKVSCICKNCGYKWDARADHLLHGHGCPNCVKRKGGRRKTQDEFLNELVEVCPDVTVLSDYVNSKTKVKCKCNKCGYEWEALPINLLRSKGCPQCSGHARLTHEEFINKLQCINPRIEVLGHFYGVDTKILCKCSVCGYEWYVKPSGLLKGRGCPNCTMHKGGRRKTKEEFISDLVRVNPNIEICGQYINNSTKIKCKCLICGNEWEALPTNLLKGKGCPNYRHHE